MGILKEIFTTRKIIETEPGMIYNPVQGVYVPLEQIPDTVFSKGVLGKGCGIEPAEERIYAPFNGTVSLVPKTRHAVGVTSDDGIELLIHVGMDTVEMNGAGFIPKVTVGQKVKCSDILLDFDKVAIQAAGHATVIVIVVMNTKEFTDVLPVNSGAIERSAPLLKVSFAKD